MWVQVTCALFIVSVAVPSNIKWKSQAPLELHGLKSLKCTCWFRLAPVCSCQSRKKAWPPQAARWAGDWTKAAAARLTSVPASNRGLGPWGYKTEEHLKYSPCVIHRSFINKEVRNGKHYKRSAIFKIVTLSEFSDFVSSTRRIVQLYKQ